jgi:hypothetical protein
MIDKIIDCPKCGEKACCYQISINEFHNSYSCFGCGFTSNDLMREGEFNFQEFESTLPELYKDLKSLDGEGRIWYPQAINITEKGTVFANGKSKDQWQWSAIQTIQLSEEEKLNPRFKNQVYKSDSKSLQNFGSDFIEACDYIGFFNA